MVHKHTLNKVRRKKNSFGNRSQVKEIQVGMGLTGSCNLNCNHCYSQALRGLNLPYHDVIQFLYKNRVSSINYGTGESILYPDFTCVVNYCYEHGIRQSVTSNGYTILRLKDDELVKFNDVDISLEFPDETLQNNSRHGNSWRLVMKSIEKCQRLGVEFSVACVLMNINYKQIPAMLKLVRNKGCNLRVNIFKPVVSAGIYELQLDYWEFWEAMEMLFSEGRLISCSEPVVNAVLDIAPPVMESPCGKNSLRIHPGGEVIPCVYWDNSTNWKIQDVTKKSIEQVFSSEPFKAIRIVPQWCRENCSKVAVCGGGCASRRYLKGQLSKPDDYCPYYHDRPEPKIKVTKSETEKELVHSSYLCTLIFR